MSSYKELLKAWNDADRPTTASDITELLLNNGYSKDNVRSILKSSNVKYQVPDDVVPEKIKHELPDGYSLESTTGKKFTFNDGKWYDLKHNEVPEEHQKRYTDAALKKFRKQEKEKSDKKNAPYNQEFADPDEIEIPTDYSMKLNNGKTVIWKGAQWTDNGKIIPKEYQSKLTKHARQKIEQDTKNSDNEKKTKNDSLYSPDAPAPEVTEPKIVVPIGTHLITKGGKTVIWQGAQWTDNGKIVKKKYQAQLTAAAEKAIKQQNDAKAKEEDDLYSTDDISPDANSDFFPMPEDTDNDDIDFSGLMDIKDNEFADAANYSSESEEIEKLASVISATSNPDKIAELLNRNDEISDIALEAILTNSTEAVLSALNDTK